MLVVISLHAWIPVFNLWALANRILFKLQLTLIYIFIAGSLPFGCILRELPGLGYLGPIYLSPATTLGKSLRRFLILRRTAAPSFSELTQPPQKQWLLQFLTYPKAFIPQNCRVYSPPILDSH